MTSELPTVQAKAFHLFAIELAQAAGSVIREAAGQAVDVYSKGLRDTLTSVDLAAERVIVEAIRDRYPEHDILTEETPASERRSRYRDGLLHYRERRRVDCNGLLYHSGFLPFICTRPV